LPLHLHDAEAAMTGPAAVEIVLSERERGELEARVRHRKIARADAMRAEIILPLKIGPESGSGDELEMVEDRQEAEHYSTTFGTTKK
jgi:hypothetical protein